TAWDAMNQLALNIRPIGQEALVERLDGHHLIDDSAPATIGDVTVYRIRTQTARAALAQYLGLFTESQHAPETGLTIPHDPTDPTAAGFLAYLDQPELAEARRHIQGLANLLAELREIGISPVEYARARDALLQRLETQRMTLEQLRGVVDPIAADQPL